MRLPTDNQRFPCCASDVACDVIIEVLLSVVKVVEDVLCSITTSNRLRTQAVRVIK